MPLRSNVVVFVNGEPITAIDIEQRSKFIQVTSQKAPPRQEVLDQLIDEKLKVREAKRWGMDISDSEVEQQFRDSWPAGCNMSCRAIDRTACKIGRQCQHAQGQNQGGHCMAAAGPRPLSVAIADVRPGSAVDAGIEEPEERETVGYEYVMRPILFLVPPGSPDAIFQSRRKEAEALRGRFRGCEESIPAVRAMRDVAVRDQVVRTSADLPEALRKILDSIPVGQLTAPELTRHGIELFAICAKHESKSDTPGRRKARETVLGRAVRSRNRSATCGSCARTR